MTQEQILIGIAVVIFGFWWWNRQPDKDGKLPDAAITVKKISEIILDFNVEKNPKLKTGYTEKSIQNQLKAFLRDKIQHVTDEYGIEGVNATKIDFNLGNGAVGLELKLASAVFKRAGQDRLVGQVRNYIKSKYDNDNLLVVIFCENEHIQDTVMKKQIENAFDDLDVKILFLEI